MGSERYESLAECAESAFSKACLLYTSYPELTCSAEEIFEEYKEYAKIIAPMVCDTGVVLDECFQTGKNVLFEGAQGTMLDIDYGTYPFVTSSPVSYTHLSI